MTEIEKRLFELQDEKCMAGVCAFLPFIDNWATCDQLSPKVFGKNKDDLLMHIKEWLNLLSELLSYKAGIPLLESV